MPFLSVYVDERTLSVLTEYGRRHDRTVEDLASAAVAEDAMRSVPPQARSRAFGWQPDQPGVGSGAGNCPR